MSSARENILAAITTLVGTATGFTAYRDRKAAVNRAEGNVAIIEPDEEAVQSIGVEIVRRELTVSIVFVGRDAIPSSELDASILSMHLALMADLSLGGLCAKIIESTTKWNIELADLTAAGVDVRYIVHYLTQAKNINAL